jgi:hypothetical protein
LPKALKAVYPEHPWKAGNFYRKTNIVTKENELNSESFLSTWGDMQGVKLQHYHLTAQSYLHKSVKIVLEILFISSAYCGRYKQYRRRFQLLHTLAPTQHSNDPMQKAISRRQYFLYKMLLSLLPKQTILLNYKHPDLIYSQTYRGTKSMYRVTYRLLDMELDIYLPNLALGFEYQGEQHFTDDSYFGTKGALQKRGK